jgi:hypothetical protein
LSSAKIWSSHRLSSDLKCLLFRACAEITSHFGASAGRADARRRDAGDAVPSSTTSNADIACNTYAAGPSDPDPFGFWRIWVCAAAQPRGHLLRWRSSTMFPHRLRRSALHLPLRRPERDLLCFHHGLLGRQFIRTVISNCECTRQKQKRHGLPSAAGGRNQIGSRFKGQRPELYQPGAAPQVEGNSKKSRAESPSYN